jgi:hypothetical protein
MPLHEFLMPELDLEMEATRKHLERVPIERFDFKPHEKSMTLGWLARSTRYFRPGVRSR